MTMKVDLCFYLFLQTERLFFYLLYRLDLGSKIIAVGDCNNEIKRCFAPWKESYDNLSTLNSRDITLPTKVCVVKATIFPVVINRCESWAIKKAECQ